jgi:hypothetical protein
MRRFAHYAGILMEKGMLRVKKDSEEIEEESNNDHNDRPDRRATITEFFAGITF